MKGTYLRRLNWSLYSSRAASANSGSTIPDCGSVPRSLRNNKMCGSGLQVCMRDKLDFLANDARTDESRNVAILDSVGYQLRAIHFRSEDGPWGVFWRGPSEESRALFEEVRCIRLCFFSTNIPVLKRVVGVFLTVFDARRAHLSQPDQQSPP